MLDKIKKIFEALLESINEEERKNSGYHIYTQIGFIK